MRIRNADGSRVLITKTLKNRAKLFFLFLVKNCNCKPSAFKREHPTLQEMKFINFFSFFVGHFCPPGSGSRDPIESGSRPGSGSGSTTLYFHHGAYRTCSLCVQVADLQKSLRQVRDSLSRTLNTEIQAWTKITNRLQTLNVGFS
jgi:hypothetical protein